MCIRDRVAFNRSVGTFIGGLFGMLVLLAERAWLNHQELLRKKGYYYNLYTKQFETEAGAAVFEGAKA